MKVELNFIEDGKEPKRWTDRKEAKVIITGDPEMVKYLLSKYNEIQVQEGWRLE